MLDDMVDDMLRHRSVIGLSSVCHRSVTGTSGFSDERRHGPSLVRSRSVIGPFAVHVIDWEHQLAHFLFHFTLQYLHAGLTQITLGGSFGGSFWDHFWDHFFDSGCGRTLYRELYLGRV
jgi:hypothetical protein